MEASKINTSAPVRERFEDLVRRGDLSGLESAWGEEVAQSGEGGPADPEAFLATADVLIKKGDSTRARTLLEVLLPTISSDPARKFAVLRRLLQVATGRSDVRAEFVAAFREAHRDDPFAEVCLAVAGVEKASDPSSAADLLERIIRFRPGSVVHHRSGWGVGVVESFDPNLR